MKSRGNYKDGRQDGVYEEWYENGQPKGQVNYKDGKREGKQCWWDESGELQYWGNFKNDKPHGICEIKNSDGTISQSIYKDGFTLSQKETNRFTDEVRINDESKKKITILPKKKGLIKI